MTSKANSLLSAYFRAIKGDPGTMFGNPRKASINDNGKCRAAHRQAHGEQRQEGPARRRKKAAAREWSIPWSSSTSPAKTMRSSKRTVLACLSPRWRKCSVRDRNRLFDRLAGIRVQIQQSECRRFLRMRRVNKFWRGRLVWRIECLADFTSFFRLTNQNPISYSPS